jgi:signal transduction histidine kinase
MVLEMLDLSRLEAGKVRLAREKFSLSELTSAVFERLQRAAEAKALQLTFELGKDCMISADPARIEQVITNFAVNAVKYTPFGGSIRVHTARNRSGNVTLTVGNDSEPLSPEALSKVWDTFYRADESRTGAGTGLGLAIAKSIIDLHGGKCWVINTNTGVEFSFELEA